MKENEKIQKQINHYYNLVYNNDLTEFDESKIGKTKAILKVLNDEMKEIKKLDKEDRDYFTDSYNVLLDELKQKDNEDIVEIFIHPMSQFYSLLNEKSTLDNLKKEYTLMKKENEIER